MRLVIINGGWSAARSNLETATDASLALSLDLWQHDCRAARERRRQDTSPNDPSDSHLLSPSCPVLSPPCSASWRSSFGILLLFGGGELFRQGSWPAGLLSLYPSGTGIRDSR